MTPVVLEFLKVIFERFLEVLCCLFLLMDTSEALCDVSSADS